ncbi:MAG: hypothetical protein S4CHLAM6_05810 [Chlamydiae bacterium]|nr:hypothetical protein [Chlamydiota bacterium]
MRVAKFLSPVLVIIGIILYIFGSYVSHQVKQGEQKISKAEAGVNQTCNITKINPYAHQIGKIFTHPIRKKISEGKKSADHYRSVAFSLHLSGIIVFALGVLSLLFIKQKKH